MVASCREYTGVWRAPLPAATRAVGGKLVRNWYNLRAVAKLVEALA